MQVALSNFPRVAPIKYEKYVGAVSHKSVLLLLFSSAINLSSSSLFSLFSDLRNLSGTTLMNLLAALFMTQLLYVIGVGGVPVSIQIYCI